MGSSSVATNVPSAEFLRVFRACASPGGRMSFASFMQLALYHPEVGYYRTAKPRVGYSAGTDYFTSSTSVEQFGHLVATACSSLLAAAGRSPRSHVFVEIGAEPDEATITAGVRHEFQEVKVLRVGEPLRLAGDCVVFSNELFDAQPCIRSVFRSGSWTE